VSCTKLPQPRIHLCRPSPVDRAAAAPGVAYVAAGHSRRGSLQVNDAGGSRRSYRNGRVDSAVAESTPFPKGSPKLSVGGTPGWHLLSSARRYGLGYLSVFFVTSARAYPPLPEFRSDQAHGHSLHLFPRGYTVTLVLRVWV
jgi:hypothetical protein